MNTQIGTIQKMQLEEKVTDGWVLKNAFGTAFLPDDNAHNIVDDDTEIEVFLFTEKDGKIKATTALPKIEVDTYGWGIVKQIDTKFGAFIDIGTDFNILLPKDDLPALESVWPVEDDPIYLRMKKDGKDRLLVIPAKEHELDDLFIDASHANLNDAVQGWIIRAGREGSVMLTEEGYRGFIHYSEREKEPRLGATVSGRVIEVKDDGTLNISLLPLKHERMDDDAKKIFAFLVALGGTIPIGNKSDPELIKNTFGMSKSAFKRAIGRLMKQGDIKPEDQQITQLKK